MLQIFLYAQQDFEKGFIYNNVREIVRIRDLIDVPHCSFFKQISIRILCQICKGTLMKVKNLIDVPDFSFVGVSYKIT